MRFTGVEDVFDGDRSFFHAHGLTADPKKLVHALGKTYEIMNTSIKRWAAKEACSKALGTGFRAGVFWKDMGVVNEPSGKPTMVLTGGARRHLDRLTPPGHGVRIHLTITDDFPYAHAFVMIEAVPL